VDGRLGKNKKIEIKAAFKQLLVQNGMKQIQLK